MNEKAKFDRWSSAGFRVTGFLLGCLLLSLAVWFSFAPFAQTPKPTLADGWTAWEQGEVDSALSIGQRFSSLDEGRFLVLLTSHAKGRYAAAVESFNAISKEYPKRAQAVHVAIESLIHLERFQEAYRLAVAEKADAFELGRLKYLSEKPPSFSLSKPIEVPFKDYPKGAYMPGFDVRINGQDGIALFDTGADFLVMGKKVAEMIGINVVCGGKGNVGSNLSTTTCYGSTDFELGGLVVKNIPVTALTATDKSSYDSLPPIFGTNVLERFISTFDYKNKKLILSPKEQSAAHIAKWAAKATAVPFYIWSDHYMFAVGLVGERKARFFVDSGLVYLYNDGKTTRQAGIQFSDKQLTRFGWDLSHLSNEAMRSIRVFDVPEPIGFPGLLQSGQLGYNIPEAGYGDFGGVKIDALISHAYLSHYTWTLDFATMTYYFR